MTLDREAARIREAIERCVERVCPPALASQRQDIVQAAYLKLLEKTRREGESDSSVVSSLPRSYLWRVAYSVTIDALRQARRKSETSLDAPEAASWEQGSKDDAPDRAVALTELAEQIRECLGLMTASRRIAAGLRLLEHSVPEIMRLAGWKERQTRTLIQRGLGDLRECLRRKGVRR